MKVFINKRIPEAGIRLLKDANLEIFIPEQENLSYEEWLITAEAMMPF
ncbi:hypothetical protein [Chryseobacterium gambrini]|nr:hypothetical protein [Chryseobacterium gambrini]MDN4031212.1 hypothetical protein [Chryseobacterium gambrini]